MNSEYTDISRENVMLRVCRSPLEPPGNCGQEPDSLPEGREELLPEASLGREFPHFLRSVSNLVAEALPLLPDLEENLDALKAAFLKALRARLAASGIDVENTRLVIGLDASGHFGLLDATPAREELPELPDLSEFADIMREMARQSLLLRSLHDMSSLVDLPEAGAVGQEVETLPCIPPYHVCLRGALSHFYFPAR